GIRDASVTGVQTCALPISSRAPRGQHTAWAYCHVPNGSTVDMLPRVEAQIERFAPGFRDCVLARRVFLTAELQAMDANLVGGDKIGRASCRVSGLGKVR